MVPTFPNFFIELLLFPTFSSKRPTIPTFFPLKRLPRNKISKSFLARFTRSNFKNQFVFFFSMWAGCKQSKRVCEVGLGFVAWNSVWRITRVRVRLTLTLNLTLTPALATLLTRNKSNSKLQAKFTLTFFYIRGVIIKFQSFFHIFFIYEYVFMIFCHNKQ